MFCFQSLLWKFSLKLCFRLLSTRFRLRLESGRADSGRSYQSNEPNNFKGHRSLGWPFFISRAQFPDLENWPATGWRSVVFANLDLPELAEAQQHISGSGQENSRSARSGQG